MRKMSFIVSSRLLSRLALVAVALTLFTSCHPEEESQPKLDISGTWELASITDTRAVAIGDEQVEVYVVFKTDEPAVTRAKKPVEVVPTTGTFRLYQKLGAGRFRTFNGTWSLTDATLTGVYDGGRPWGAEYQVSVDDTNKRLTLAAPTETCVYTSATLPAGL